MDSIHSLRIAAVLLAILNAPAIPASAQPVALTPSQLDQLVARVALYPDPLLSQVLTASTYWNETPEAAEWDDQHRDMNSDAIAKAIQEDHLQWDPSVLALLPFPSVLEMFAKDPAWTQQLGNAVLTQRAEVMDAVQRMRKKAMDNGYLQPNENVRVVSNAGYIEILPVNAGVIYVPYYNSLVVFSRPAISGAIRFGPGITIGASF